MVTESNKFYKKKIQGDMTKRAWGCNLARKIREALSEEQLFK